MAISNNTAINLDQRYVIPGLNGIQGINQTKDRLALGDYECWYVLNFEPTAEGWTNNKIGLKKITSSKATTTKIQGIEGYGNKLIYVSDGNAYDIDFTGGNPSLISGGSAIFDSTAQRVRMAKNQGKTGSTVDKIYACDGLSEHPRVYDGSTITSFTFNDPIITFGKPKTVKNFRRRTLWTFTEDSVNRNGILMSQEEDGDEYDTTGSAEIDALYDEVFPGDDYIVGSGTIQFKGQDSQRDALVIAKSKQSFMATDITLNTGVRTITFNNNGIDLGAVSPDAILQFGNDLWILTKTGIKGFNAVLEGSGGVASFNNSKSSRLDRLIEQSAENSNFSSAFAIHHPDRQKVRFFMPENATTSTSMDGFTYPEIPCNYALNYAYGALPDTETNPDGEAFYARGGAGFAFNCACVHKGRLFLGDYFGDIWELDSTDATDDYIPLDGETDQIIYSYWQTPYMLFGTDIDSKKRIMDWTLHAKSNNSPIEYNFDVEIIENELPFKRNLNRITLNSTTSQQGVAIWNQFYWNQANWASSTGSLNKIKLRPQGWGNAFGITLMMPSKHLIDGIYKSNNTWLYGISGTIEKGRNR